MTVKTPDDLIAGLKAIEGGYVNDPNDSGGETNFGITVAVARANTYMGAMKDMTWTQAAMIYKAEFWNKPGFAIVYNTYPRVAAELLDTGVNMGTAVAVMFWQRCLNVLYNAGVGVDGVMHAGGETLIATAAKRTAHTPDDEAVMLKVLNSFQGERYAELVEKNQKDRTFVFGWFANRVSI